MKKRGFDHFYESTEDIPLVLDSYEDIFSDFDPRPYSERALSEDFLFECKKAAVEKKGKIHLRLFLPKSKRHPLDEIKIKKRLKEHFHKHFLEKKKDIMSTRLNGFTWSVIGFCMMFTSAFFWGEEGPFGINLLVTLVQPAGWFFMWEGLAKIFIAPKEHMPNYTFYKKMANSTVTFANY